jgi:IclR family transcriptional regulator, acetate operon repressor
MCPVHRDSGEFTAVGRAALILKQFRYGEKPLGAAVIARRTGLPRATAHRMLHEMARVGLLERAGTGFRPGLLLFELGQLVPQQQDLYEAARRHMAVLHEGTGHNVGLAVLREGDVIYVDILRGGLPPRLPQRSGGRWPAYASCSGKAMLAFCSSEDVDRALGRPLRRLTDRTIADSAVFRAELDHVRRAHVAFDRQESFPNIVGVASPVLDPGGRAVAALSVSGPAGRFNVSRLDAAVRASALAIARDLAAAESLVSPVLIRRV